MKIKVSIVSALFFLGTLILGQNSSFAAEDGSEAQYRELCESGKAEGLYSVSLGKAGKFHVSILCTGPSQMAAVLRDTSSQNIIYSLVHTSIDDDVLSFVTFHVSKEDAKTMGYKGLDGRLRVSLSLLKAGVLKGTFQALNLIDPIEIQAKRETTFANLLARVDSKADFRKQFSGTFLLKEGTPSEIILTLQIIGDIQRISMRYPSGDTFALYDGLKASQAGNIFYATSGVDDGLSGRGNLYHIRGEFLNANELEVFYLDTDRGLLGPYRAKRRSSSL